MKTNYIDNLPTRFSRVDHQVKAEVSTVDREKTAKAVIATSELSLKPSEPLLNNETIGQLSRLQEFTASQLEINVETKIDLSGTPHLSWLKGRDDVLYSEKRQSLIRGANAMQNFKKIVDNNKDNLVLSREDWNFIEGAILRFKGGFNRYKTDRAQSNDPVVHQVLDYIAPKTYQRLETLKQFLVGKTKAPESEKVDVKLSDNKQLISSTDGDQPINDRTIKLLDFLAKDLDWYDQYLAEEENFILQYNFKYSQSLFKLYTDVSAS